MARETEILLAGGLNLAVQLDALDGFVGTPEVGVECRITTKHYSPWAPAADAVGKRIYLTVIHPRGCSFEAAPIVDGRVQVGMTRIFQKPAPTGQPVRENFLLPTGKPQQGGAYMTGSRGATFGVRIRAFMPAAGFTWESLQIEGELLQAARGRKVSE